jgi:DNA mismatch repair protein MLH3
MQCYESQRILPASTYAKCGHHPAYEVRDSACRFAREDLGNAIILGQVDKKFIACIMDDENNGSRSLVLIDQHAADERVRVERFLKDLCTDFLTGNGVETALLDPALPILLTRHEALTLTRSADTQDEFAKWGVQFDQLAGVSDVTVDEATSSGYVQVLVRTVPEIVGSKVS